MSFQNPPKIGGILFLRHRKVVVIDVYSIFGLVVVRYFEETKEFCVDACALSYKADYTNSITLKIAGGVCVEQDFEFH